jgi:GntR family transcriptional regulator, transcriptional repressor for pyruvate dehydrogenase complex
MSLHPLRVQSLKQACIERLESLILSGEFKIGEHLPSERELAVQFGISRPVLHEALVDLALRGLVRIVPRHGVFVNDFRTHGSLAILDSLLSYHNGRLDPALAKSLLEMRMLLETETARLAALNCTPSYLEELHRMIQWESIADLEDVITLTEQDFAFHLKVAVASSNLIYPLIINSFKNVYTHLTGAFFTAHAAGPVIGEVFEFHNRLVMAIETSSPEVAAAVMREMLYHGEKHLKGVL